MHDPTPSVGNTSVGLKFQYYFTVSILFRVTDPIQTQNAENVSFNPCDPTHVATGKHDDYKLENEQPGLLIFQTVF